MATKQGRTPLQTILGVATKKGTPHYFEVFTKRRQNLSVAVSDSLVSWILLLVENLRITQPWPDLKTEKSIDRVWQTFTCQWPFIKQWHLWTILAVDHQVSDFPVFPFGCGSLLFQADIVLSHLTYAIFILLILFWVQRPDCQLGRVSLPFQFFHSTSLSDMSVCSNNDILLLWQQEIWYIPKPAQEST